MKKLSVLFAITILVVGLGFYRGWFAFSRSAPDMGSNKVSITLDANPDKMKEDAKIVTARAKQLTGGVRNDSKADGRTNESVKTE
jgi:hypothetical protein